MYEKYKKIELPQIDFTKHCIYMFVNVLTGQKYIGQSNSIFKRIHTHFDECFVSKRANQKCLFYKNVQEYGWQNFKLFILENNIEKTDVDEKEKFWIKLENTFVDNNPKIGLNMTTGGSVGFVFSKITKENRKGDGNSFFGKKHNEESLKKIGNATKSRIPANLGKKFSGTQLENIQIAAKKRRGKPSEKKGIKLSEEAKKKLKDINAEKRAKDPFYRMGDLFIAVYKKIESEDLLKYPNFNKFCQSITDKSVSGYNKLKQKFDNMREKQLNESIKK